MRGLGLGTVLKWFLIACVALAIWRSFNGDLGAIATTIWHWVERGADVVTNIWRSVDKPQV